MEQTKHPDRLFIGRNLTLADLFLIIRSCYAFAKFQPVVMKKVARRDWNRQEYSRERDVVATIKKIQQD